MHMRLSIGLVWMTGALALAACGGKEAPPTAADSGASPAATAAATGAAATAGNWTPEALEELLAPVALFPDVVLGHVLTAATNPQEVLDAGNWLIENQALEGAAIDAEAGKLGLSPSVRALLQFPDVMDMLCMQMDWTTELGEAFTADQGAVLDAVQRLRAQAKDVGNLATSPQLKVETESQDGKEIITVEPPSPEVVYVPKYDPQAVYAPPPANIPPPSTINVTPAAGTTTTVTTSGSTTTVASEATATSSESKGHSTGSLITTGLLAFGAGILVNEVFDDDDDWDNYGPNYYHGGMYYGGRPYYPPPPYMYRPPYGNGYYPGHGYNRPPNYQHGFNNNTIIVNNGGNDYWNRNKGGINTRPAKSPITAAKPKRNDLNDLNRQSREREQTREGRQPAERREAASRDTKPVQARQSGYAGARPENQAAREKMVAKAPPVGVAKDLPQRPKTEYKGAARSEYKGAKDRPATANRPATAPRPAAGSKPATRNLAQQRPAAQADRGRDRPEAGKAAARPQPSANRDGNFGGGKPAAATRQMPAAGKPKAAPAHGGQTAFGGGGGAQAGKADRQASQRGRNSMGGGGGNKPRKPKH